MTIVTKSRIEKLQTQQAANTANPIMFTTGWGTPPIGEAAAKWEAVDRSFLIAGSGAAMQGAATGQDVSELRQLRDQISRLALRVEQLVSSMADGRQTFSTMLTSLGHDELEVQRPISVTVRWNGDEAFVASFFDAHISAGGDSPQEAIKHLQELIAEFFIALESANDGSLGATMRRQKNVLTEMVCRK